MPSLFTKFIAWNYQGIRQSLPFRALNDFIKFRNPSVIFLRETKCVVHSFWKKKNLKEIGNVVEIVLLGDLGIYSIMVRTFILRLLIATLDLLKLKSMIPISLGPIFFCLW